MTHDPLEYIKNLKQLLVSDKKNIAFLFGAGTSLPKIPTTNEMMEEIENNLCENHQQAIQEIKSEVISYNIETLLSNIEQKIQIIAGGKLNGLDVGGFESLRDTIKNEIKSKVSVSIEESLKDSLHYDFAEWIGLANRKYSVEIFTTNYDYLLEQGLEEANIPFYDGFTGSYNPFFNADSVEDMEFIPKQTKLWKMHGSLGWHYDPKNRKICRKSSDNNEILIYPSTLKYDESRKQPYIALIDRLTNFLKKSDTLLITCGYSFGDEHINERIITALNSNDSGHVIALYYDIEKNNGDKNCSLVNGHSPIKLANKNKKISIYGRKRAVIGGQLGEWQLKQKPNENDMGINDYFKGDSEEKNGEWKGIGELMLPDFSNFVQFLRSMILYDNPNEDRDEKNE